MPDFLSLPNLMPYVQTCRIYVFGFSAVKIVHVVKRTCQYVHIFDFNLLKYYTRYKVSVKIHTKIIICWCTVPVEICAALLHIVALQIWFLAIAWPFHLRCTTFQPPEIVQPQHPYLLNSVTQPTQFFSLHTHNITPLFGGSLNSLLNTQEHAHNCKMPRVSRRNPTADSSDDESLQKKQSHRTTAKKTSSPSSKGTKAKAKAPPKGPKRHISPSTKGCNCCLLSSSMRNN